jgi:hypothetical protein
MAKQNDRTIALRPALIASNLEIVLNVGTRYKLVHVVHGAAPPIGPIS